LLAGVAVSKGSLERCSSWERLISKARQANPMKIEDATMKAAIV
jgi:hypothetical protein